MSITNGERYSSNGSDSAKAKFQGMRIYNHSQTWDAWADSYKCYDNDPDYDNQLSPSDPTHVQVVAGTSDIKLNVCY